MAALDFPHTIDTLSAAWLATVFGAKPTRFAAEFLEGGMLADAYRLRLEWPRGHSDLPASAVVKLPTAIEAQRQMALDNSFYRKEVSFFRDLAAHVPVRMPKVYAALDDGSSEAESFVILMEDLGTDFLPFDQVNDQPAAPHVATFCDTVALLHGTLWESDLLREDWISPGGRYVFPVDAISRQCSGQIEPLRRAWRQYYGSEVFAIADTPSVEPLTEIIAGPKSELLLDYITSLLDARPKTLLHGDLRCDNLFRTKDVVPEAAELAIIDWQLVHGGPPGPEFTQAWMHSLPIELRRRDTDMLRRYHARLVEVAPAAAAYTVEMLLEDYRLGYLLYWMMNVALFPQILPGTDTAPDGERMLRLYELVMRSMQIALEDHNCLDLVQRLSAELRG